MSLSLLTVTLRGYLIRIAYCLFFHYFCDLIRIRLPWFHEMNTISNKKKTELRMKINTRNVRTLTSILKDESKNKLHKIVIWKAQVAP